MEQKVDIILASGSPRRKMLLEREGVNFTVRVSQADETLDEDTLRQPEEAAKKLAERKAGAVVQEVLGEAYVGAAAVIGADTMVVCDDRIFGKPADADEARSMLRTLSGRTHQVVTGVSVWLMSAPDAENVSLGFRTIYETSHVTFKELDEAAIDAYIATGEPFDKAGGYGAQGEGAALIAHVAGDLDNVIGLPVGRLMEEFSEIFEAAK